MLQVAGRQSAFSTWLRTGVWPNAGPEVEVKYNHWHDEDDGRFTFSQTGRHDGSWQGGGFTGGGWGSAGGGGASGSWESPDGKRGEGGRSRSIAPAARIETTPPPEPSRGFARSSYPTVDGRPSAASPLRLEVRNGYAFGIDAQGRTKTVSGTITLAASQRRSRSAQLSAGGVDRRASDDGGHYIAARFNGPTDAFNHFAQDANFNRGGYRALEDEWARATKAGKRVSVTILPIYYGRLKRPSRLRVSYTINNKTNVEKFDNERHGGRHGR